MSSPKSVLAEIDRISRRERLLIDSFEGKGSHVDTGAEKLAALLGAVRALEGVSIPYALIGGLAVGVHSGTPRATLDVDLAALASRRADVAPALEAAGFRKTGEFAHSVNFRHPSGEPVQVAFDPGFDAMILRAQEIDVGALRVRIVQRDDLVAMKERASSDPTRRESKRLRDQADIALLRGDVPDPDEGW